MLIPFPLHAWSPDRGGKSATACRYRHAGAVRRSARWPAPAGLPGTMAAASVRGSGRVRSRESRDPRRPPSRRRAVPPAPWGAAAAAGLRDLHGHERGAGLPQLADKALRLALRGAPVGIALAVILVDPDQPREHVHTRFPDGAQEGVMIPARRLHERCKLVPGIRSFLDVVGNLRLLRLQECLELLVQLGFVFPQLGVLRFWGVLGKREGA